MKKNIKFIIVLLFTGVLYAGCEVIGDIFKAGVWVGILLVVAVVAVIALVVGKAKK